MAYNWRPQRDSNSRYRRERAVIRILIIFTAFV